MNTKQQNTQAPIQHQVWATDELTLRQANAGMLPAHLAELCRTEQIEETLHLVSILNRWAKSGTRLLYADRQGLYQVKARLLREAYTTGHIRATAYIGSTIRFTPFAQSNLDWLLDNIAETAATIKKRGKGDKREHGLYEEAAGCRITEEPLKLDAVKQYILQRLAELRQKAERTRQPVPVAALDALLLRPEHIVDDYRWKLSWRSEWCDLDAGELGAALDPEWCSLVEFCYEATDIHFHLPFRIAEQFVELDVRWRLQGEGRVREGEFSGGEIGEEESRAHPIKKLLKSLGVEWAMVCPAGLIDKEVYMRQRAREWEQILDDEF